MEVSRVTIAQNWLETSEQDLEVAREISARWPASACFHAQQCGEKSIKAITVFHAGDALRSHLISSLLDELAELRVEIPEDVASAARSLGKFYMPTRYPDALGGMSPTTAYMIDDANNAVTSATVVFEYAKTIVYR